MIQRKHFSVAGAALILSGAVSTWAVAANSAHTGSPDNAGITAQVKSAIAQRRDLQAPNDIYVETRDHVVYLSGRVYTSLSGAPHVVLVGRLHIFGPKNGGGRKPGPPLQTRA